MDKVLLVISIILFIIVVIVLVDNINSKRKIKKLVQSIHGFVLYPDQIIDKSLKEGEYANLCNEISELENQFIILTNKGIDREKEVNYFVENMAHQIKNIITSLQIQLDILSIENANSPHLSKMQKSIDRLNWEIGTVLKSSQLAEGKIVMKYEKCNLINLVNDVIKPLIPIAESKGVEIEIIKNDDVEIEMDIFWMSQAVENILKNALEHTKDNSKVAISIELDPGKVKLLVEDEGEGIVDEELESVFRRYTRCCRTKKGFGIGLSMAKDIVEFHHGTIKAGNRIGEGAIFTIVLPRLEGASIYR